MWAGVDVGGRRKGFHVALVTGNEIAELKRCATPADVVSALPTVRVVAIDSPRALASPGETVRPCERELARIVCGIRWTPGRIAGNRYYEWIANGLELYAMLPDAVECFPTASWTRWAGPRRGSRAIWTAGALPLLGLSGLPSRMGQDFRDAIAAAVTARLYDEGLTESFGPIVVPRGVPGATRERLDQADLGALRLLNQQLCDLLHA
jgi:predicted nuclease with RNAse H fold